MPHTGGLVRWVIRIEPWRFLNTLVGTGLMASGTAALNQWYERDVDSKIRRTARRPIPSGRLNASRALLFGVSDQSWRIRLTTTRLVSLTGFEELAIAVNTRSQSAGISRELLS